MLLGVNTNMSDDYTRKAKLFTGKDLTDISKRQNSTCIYCGHRVDIHHKGKFNREHIIPRAIHKWLEHNNKDNLDLDKLWAISTSKDMVAVVHPWCNTKRGSRLITENEVDLLYLPNNIKDILKFNIKTCDIFIKAYTNFIKSTLKKQNNCCADCGIKIVQPKFAVLRRIDLEEYRTADNAKVLCEKCGSKHISKK